MKWVRRLALGLLGGVVGAYAAALVTLYVLQRDFQYEPQGQIFSLDEAGLAGLAEPVSIATGGGAAVAGWYAPPRQGQPLIVYYKGNSGSFSHEYERYAQFVADGFGFLAVDYRGFPMSPGDLSQDNVLEDALAAFDFAAATGHALVIWGRSLGSGPASYVASRREAAALLLETPFYSAVAVAHDRYWFFPVGWLMHDQYPVGEWIGAVEEPVYVAHGTADETIGTHHGRLVHAAAPNKADLWIVEGAGHADLWAAGIWPRARTFFAQNAD